jgi:hypothetical protein
MGERWAAPDGRVVQMLVAAAEHTPALLVLNGTPATVEVTPPKLLSEARVQLLWDSSLERPGEIGEPAPPGPTPVPGMSMRLYAVTGTARASGLD